jgi:hypothetical protein
MAHARENDPVDPLTEGEILELRRRFGREGSEGRLSAAELYVFALSLGWDLTNGGSATVAEDVGRYGEAAQDFLAAADRFDAEHARGDGLTGDEDEWATAARHLGAVCLVRAGEFLATQMLLPRLDADDRRQIESLLAR